MKTIMQVSGKASQVFRYVGLVSRHKGKVTLKELNRDNKTLKLHLRS